MLFKTIPHRDYLSLDITNPNVPKAKVLTHSQCVLFFSIGTHVDPQILIAKIEPGLVIPNLKHALATIMQDYRLQKDLQEACKKIVESDAYTLITRQEEMQKRGSSVTSGISLEKNKGILY